MRQNHRAAAIQFGTLITLGCQSHGQCSDVSELDKLDHSDKRETLEIFQSEIALHPGKVTLDRRSGRDHQALPLLGEKQGRQFLLAGFTQAVVSVAVNSVDPLYLSGDFGFQRIVSSGFSNGWVAHKEFNAKAIGAVVMTNVIFDIDGVAAQSTWQPSNGVIYRDQTSPTAANPNCINWFVGGRWNQFSSLYPPGAFNTHAYCRNHLLYHGLTEFCL